MGDSGPAILKEIRGITSQARRPYLWTSGSCVPVQDMGRRWTAKP